MIIVMVAKNSHSNWLYEKIDLQLKLSKKKTKIIIIPALTKMQIFLYNCWDKARINKKSSKIPWKTQKNVLDEVKNNKTPNKAAVDPAFWLQQMEKNRKILKRLK
jgi:hypothetical protein